MSNLHPHKVLMTLMGMEIGGAETHVLELSKTLKHMGLDVHVVSNGGVYVKELEECGIKHYRVPLHNKQFINVFSSYKALKKIILENDIQLVHAHARIPAFICGLLQKRLKFKLVTSAHSDFSVAFPFNLLSNWGDKVLAVSDDIKSYLLANYNIEERNVSLTINGIDTEKFTQDVVADDIYTEFGFCKDSLKIVCVSRMDKDSSLPPHVLVEAAETAVLGFDQKIEIIIVGGGEEFDAIKTKANAVNDRLGYKLIHIIGARTDVNKFLAIADIFVNVARAALEAMAAGTAVVLAGTRGYLGIFDNETKKLAVESNFTCRNGGATTADKLATDLRTLIAMDGQSRARLGEYGRELVCNNYSLSRMAQDAVDIYDSVFVDDNPVNIVISGYYGYNNSGDDIVLKSIVQNLRAHRSDLRITVLALKPKEIRAQFHVDAVHRFNLLLVFLRLRRAKLLITGGGNLIQDETSTQSLLYYLWVINTARFLGVKNMLYSKGIGPVSRRANISRVRRSISRVDLIALREAGSLNVLQEIGISHPQTYITADAAFALPPVEGGEKYLAQLGISGGFFCIAIRPWPQNPPDLEVQLARYADYLVDTYGYQAVFIPMRPEQDNDITRRVIANMQNPAIFVDIIAMGNNHDIGRGILGLSSFAICMRLHALIYAMEKGVPAIGLVYSPKIYRFLEAMGQEWHMPIEDTSYDKLVSFTGEIHANKGEISAAIYEAGAKLRKLAARNAELCMEMIEEIQPLGSSVYEIGRDSDTRG